MKSSHPSKPDVNTRFKFTKKSVKRFSLNSFPVKCAKNLDFVHDENKKNTVNTYTGSQNSIKFWFKSPQWYTCLFKTHRLVAFTRDQLIQLGRYSRTLFYPPRETSLALNYYIFCLKHFYISFNISYLISIYFWILVQKPRATFEFVSRVQSQTKLHQQGRHSLQMAHFTLQRKLSAPWPNALCLFRELPNSECDFLTDVHVRLFVQTHTFAKVYSRLVPARLMQRGER